MNSTKLPPLGKDVENTSQRVPEEFEQERLEDEEDRVRFFELTANRRKNNYLSLKANPKKKLKDKAMHPY